MKMQPAVPTAFCCPELADAQVSEVDVVWVARVEVQPA
jgi:hypothetical protein